MLQREVVELSDLYEKSTISGRVFVLLVNTSILAVFFHALLNSVGGTYPLGLFNRIYFGSYDLHRLTVLCISVSFCLHWCATKHLYPLKRFVVNVAITGWYTYFGGVLWTTFSVIYRQKGFWYLPYLGVVFISILLIVLDKKSGFFKLNISRQTKRNVGLLLVTQVMAYIAMSEHGFWQALNLSDAGIGPDPNINLFWVINRLVSFFILYPLLSNPDIRAPLVFNPEVF